MENVRPEVVVHHTPPFNAACAAPRTMLSSFRTRTVPSELMYFPHAETLLGLTKGGE
jgi:hypothetical protein